MVLYDIDSIVSPGIRYERINAVVEDGDILECEVLINEHPIPCENIHVNDQHAINFEIKRAALKHGFKFEKDDESEAENAATVIELNAHKSWLR